MKPIHHIAIILLTIGIMIATLFVPQMTTLNGVKRTNELGFPLHFVRQDLSSYNPPALTYSYAIQDIHEFPTKMLWLNTIISFLIIFVILEIVVSWSVKKSGNGFVQVYAWASFLYTIYWYVIWYAYPTGIGQYGYLPPYPSLIIVPGLILWMVIIWQWMRRRSFSE